MISGELSVLNSHYAKKNGSLKESFFLKIVWFSLNQVSPDNLGVSVPLRFQKHTSLSIFTWPGDSHLWTTGDWSLFSTPGGICPSRLWSGGRELLGMPLHKFTPGAWYLGEFIKHIGESCPVLHPFILGSQPRSLEQPRFCTIIQTCPDTIGSYSVFTQALN